MNIGEFFNLFNTIVGIGSIIVIIDSLVLLSDFFYPWIPQRARNVIMTILPIYTIVIAIGGIVGPLMYQYYFGFEPCMWCWYNRIFSWPALIISVMSLFDSQNIKKVFRYIILFATIATVIGLYHYSTQLGLAESIIPCSVDSSGPSCSGIDVIIFNFLTIPLMAVFVSVATIILALYRNKFGTIRS
jgi:disulfide bond formation protein DsbB